jgi:hypothetical protein
MTVQLAATIAAVLFGADVSHPSESDRLEVRIPAPSEWVLESWETNGERLDLPPGGQLKLDGKGNGRLDVGFVVDYKFSYRLGKSPRHQEIDLGIEVRSEEGQTRPAWVYGIYRLERDRLVFCLAAVGNDRPTDFVTKSRDSHHLLSFKRKK